MNIGGITRTRIVEVSVNSLQSPVKNGWITLLREDVMNSLETSRRRLLQMALAGSAVSLTSRKSFAQPTIINFWDMIWGGRRYSQAAQALVDRYNSEHPTVKVVYRSVPWKNWYETFVTAVASGSAPDVSTGGGFQAVQFYDQGAIMPVDQVVAQLHTSDFMPGALEAVKYDGHYVALPWAVDVRALFYRKDLLDAAGVAVPTNWAELRQAAKTLTAEGRYGLVSSGDAAGMHWILASAINNGGGLFDTEGKAAISSERTQEALQFLADFAADGSLNPASVGYVNDDARGAFFRGEAAFLLSGTGLPDQAGDANKHIGTVPPLRGPHGDVGTISWVNNIMVYNQTEHPAETLAFLSWWSENASSLWTEGYASGIPARTSIAEHPYFQQNPIFKYIIDTYLPIAKTMSESVGGTFPALNEVDGDGFLLSLVQAIWQGRPIDGPTASAHAYLQDILAD